MILTHDQEELKAANKLLFDEKMKYNSNTYMQWVMLIVGITIGIGLGWLAQEAISSSFFAFYKRDGVDKMAEERYGNRTFNDLLVDELLIPSYEYNHQRPRFYSRYFREIDPLEIDVYVRRAATASSSAPGFFDP